jgi:hypothetical protein
MQDGAGLARPAYSFAKVYVTWQVQHVGLMMVGIILDYMNTKGPVLLTLLGCVSISQLLLKLMEGNDSQLWTLPVLFAVLRTILMGFLASQARFGPSSQAEIALFAVLFVVLGVIGGVASRVTVQFTALASHLDGQMNVFATAFYAILLRSRNQISILGIPMAIAPFLVMLLPRALPRNAKRAIALQLRYSPKVASISAALALLSVVPPAFTADARTLELSRVSSELAASVVLASVAVVVAVILGASTGSDTVNHHAQ